MLEFPYLNCFLDFQLSSIPTSHYSSIGGDKKIMVLNLLGFRRFRFLSTIAIIAGGGELSLSRHTAALHQLSRLAAAAHEMSTIGAETDSRYY